MRLTISLEARSLNSSTLSSLSLGLGLGLYLRFLRSLNLSPCLSLSSLPSCDLVSLYQHAHTMHHLESLLTISPDNLCLDNLDIFKEDLENQSLRRTLVTFTRAFIMSLSLSIEHEHAIHRTCLFSLSERLKVDNTIRVNQLVTILLIESSIHLLDQNRYPVITSLIHIESRKSPTAELFDVDSGRISIITVNTKEYHLDVLA
ncbi:hypothetical protein Tco_1225649 [Tanacetum coccineum]